MKSLINEFAMVLYLIFSFMNMTMTVSRSLLTMPSGPYASQGCLNCTFDEDWLCCKCPTTYYEKTFITEDAKSLDDEEENIKPIFAHRYTDYQTICMPSKNARDCDGTIIYCGNHLICSYELLEYKKKGQC